ncbi:MAG TPA: alanine racemase [Acidimicrobiales bacterium]|jgi:alanine racemase|nr:alanine racemase [Acidimicrobiales bacterium]
MGRRPVWAEIDLGAVRDNTRVLTNLVAPARVCAVVKAFGYGHGPVRVAEAALSGGATWLAVATVEEGVQLRQGGITEPVLLLSEPPPPAMGDVVSWQLTPTLYTQEGVEAAAKAITMLGGTGPLAVHLKVDTGMHRVGATSDEAFQLASAVARAPELELEGFCTHLAVADEPHNSFTAQQVERFNEVVARLAAAGVRPTLLHASNSAGALTQPAARYDLVRCGLAVYGLAPSPELADHCRDLEPAMTLKARVTYVKQVPAGDRISYGLRYRFERESTVATVPIGYADGVPRRLADQGGEVLIGGRRRPIAGSVTMDQLMVDCGDDDGVVVGDEVVLLGRQGPESIGAWEWADLLDTIAYEVTCGISARVPRVYV